MRHSPRSDSAHLCWTCALEQKLGRKVPRFTGNMCLVKRTKKQPPTSSEVFTPISRMVKSKPSKAAGASESSVELTYNSKSTTNSSKESRLSSASATSLTNIREMLSDGPIIFQYKDLCKATDSFSHSKQLGTSAYRGKLQKTDIAIVVDKRTHSSGSFVSEIKNLGSVHHANLVRLLGGCMNGDHVYLVYDHVNGGNLRQYLHSAHSPGFSALPTWTLRIQVALDVAKGLEYLHHHTHTPTVHKYIKSSNILLDDDLHVKIAYFGVARIRGETGCAAKELHLGEISPTMRRSHSVKITGIHGYMAPEYVASGVISTKLDVFAFGIILLELLSGKEPVSFQPGATHEMKKTLLNEVIVSICSDRDAKSRLRSWIDPVLRDKFPLDCAMKAAALARSCVDPLPEMRPDMSKVAMTLLQIQMSSQIWDDKMKASKDLQTSTMQAR